MKAKKEIDPNAWLAAAVKAVDAKPRPKPKRTRLEEVFETDAREEAGPLILINWKRGR
jgi:hypothetical protein